MTAPPQLNRPEADALVQALPKVGPYERAIFQKLLLRAEVAEGDPGRNKPSHYDRWLAQQQGDERLPE